MRLVRSHGYSLGVFGKLLNNDKSVLCDTLEHAYPTDLGYFPRLPDGDYECVRGKHRLGEKLVLIETFEVTKVPGHTGILFHVGNYNADSQGCILLGDNTNNRMISNSFKAFQRFMKTLECVDKFKLEVTTCLTPSQNL